MTPSTRGSTAVLFVLLLAPLARPLTAQQSDDSPEQVTSRYVAAMRAGDWNGMAALMHPAALHQLRELFAVLFEASNADDVRQQFLGVATLAEARALSDTAVFAGIMRAATRQSAGVTELLRSAQVEVLGQVDEGHDTTHVVYRMTMTIEGTPISRMDVISLARSPHGWRGLLKGDVSALAAAIRAAVERRD